MRTLHSIIDPFVRGVGGELVSEIVGNKNPPSNADYLFRRHNVIAELKALEAGGFVASFQRKLTKLCANWHRTGRFVVYGTVHVQSSRLPADCREEMFSAMAESIQKHVIVSANKQIKSTKELLGLPDAKGLLWVASDGNSDFQPGVVWYLLTRILQKKKESGNPAYSNIDGVAYFNPRMPARVPGADKPALLWFSGVRRPETDGQLKECLSLLKDAWPLYVAWAQGVSIENLTSRPEGISFWGVEPKTPQIEIK